MKISSISTAKKTLIIIALIILAFTIKHYFFTKPVNNFLSAPVVKGNLESAVLATGTLQAVTEVDVGAQVSGQLKSLKVALGDRVKKGQLLAEIDPILQKNQLLQANARLDSVIAQKNAQLATFAQQKLALIRQQTMIKNAATSREELETAQASVATTKANIESLQAQIREAKIQVASAKANLAYTQISAPIDGEVVDIVTKEGQTVVSSQAAPTILRLADLSKMTIYAQISEADVINVKPGMPVYFTILGAPEKRFYATLRAIEPSPDPSSSGAAIYYDGLFDVSNPKNLLRIKMTAQVSIVQATASNVLNIPSAALGKHNKNGLYRVQILNADGSVEVRKVKIGLNNNVNAEVTQGLKLGEKVIIGKTSTSAPSGNNTSTRLPPHRFR